MLYRLRDHIILQTIHATVAPISQHNYPQAQEEYRDPEIEITRNNSVNRAQPQGFGVTVDIWRLSQITIDYVRIVPPQKY